MPSKVCTVQPHATRRCMHARTAHTHATQWSRPPSTRIDRLVPTRCLVTTGREGRHFASQRVWRVWHEASPANRPLVRHGDECSSTRDGRRSQWRRRNGARWIQSKRSAPEHGRPNTHLREPSRLECFAWLLNGPVASRSAARSATSSAATDLHVRLCCCRRTTLSPPSAKSTVSW